MLVMKLTIMLLTAAFINVSAAGFAQGVTLSGSNLPLEKVLDAIREQTDYVVFSTRQDREHTKPVTLSVKNMPVEEVLRIALKDQMLGFTIEDKTIFLFRASPSAQPFAAKPLDNKPVFIPVTGRIVDKAGQPVPGVSVRVRNSQTGTITDAEGRFSLVNITAHAVVDISAIGFASLTIRLSNGAFAAQLPAGAASEEAGSILRSAPEDLLIQLAASTATLAEITVNKGYYRSSQQLNTGSVSTVTGKTIEKQPVSNVLGALQGRVPGMEITQSNGLPGSNFTVMIRGKNSIDNGNEPLYVVDGVPWLSNSLTVVYGAQGSQSPFHSLNPVDIESIEVLKDADATAIYGSRGANGVILITTKKGTAGKTTVDFNYYRGMGRPTHLMPMMSTQQYLEMRREAMQNNGQTPTVVNAPDLLLFDTTRYTDWQDMLIGKNANVDDAKVTVSGGNGNTRMRLSAGFRRENTVFSKELADKRSTVQLNVSQGSNNKRFLASLTVNYSNDDNRQLPTDLTSLTYAMPHIKLYEDNGDVAWTENGSSVYTNPLANFRETFVATTNNLISNLNLEYKLAEELTLKLNAGYTNTHLKESSVRPLNSIQPGNSRTSGWGYFGDNAFKSWILEPQLLYSTSRKSGDWDALFGMSWQQDHNQGQRLMAENYSSEALLYSIAGAGLITATDRYSLYRYQSFFGRINYSWQKKYVVNLTGRNDGSSRFGPGRQYALFGAAGAAWVFSEESFVKEALPFLNFGKLRASYGITGNDRIGDYQFMDTYGAVSYIYQGIKGISPQRLFNADYGWENNRKLEAALELGFLNDRINFSGDWFKNRSGNQLVSYTLPTQTGFSGITRNLPAVVQNSGVELQLDVLPVKTRKIRWNSVFNITIARNKLLEFPNLATSSYASTYEVGQSLSILKLYPYLGVSPETGVYTFDLNAGRSVIKDMTTKYYGGWGNNLQWKNFNLDVFLQFVNRPARDFRNSLSASLAGIRGYNMPAVMAERWQKKGDESRFQQYYVSGGDPSAAMTNFRNSTGIVVDGSFIRLKNVALSYQLPENISQRMHATYSRVYLQCQNLLTLTDYEGHDPETQGVRVLPPLRMLTAGVQVSF
ncbi:SusC/RagA family TonB-linked outer membrane protein [Chitinophaga cymbidii]|uniref:SusC/RagA family TonB-linked outer membrane protein n=2 Tax=Chitinophaga cymbidii TaxID=1096750 RepID=A0A512RN55_9BACT|nr:SusC/RagA family TonB-linked outer membrane protein [Chitinophaga cymbidii]